MSDLSEAKSQAAATEQEAAVWHDRYHKANKRRIQAEAEVERLRRELRRSHEREASNHLRRAYEALKWDYEREVAEVERLRENSLGLAELDALLWVTDTNFQRQDPNIREARGKLAAQRTALAEQRPEDDRG